jgi:two-component system sensor histidine kinase KdpD
LRDGQWAPDLVSGSPLEESSVQVQFPVDDETMLQLTDAALDNQDRQLITAFAGRLAAGLHSQRLMIDAAEMRERAETDALRIGLLRSVAHDLKPSLATIETNVSSLLRSKATWSVEEQRTFLTSISREVNALTRLVTNLLDSGRLEAKLIAPRSRRVALVDLVRSARETIDTKGHRVEVDLPSDLPNLVTDPDLLERVIANVINNACLFSPYDQSVRINAGSTGTTIELLVIDQGPGTRDVRRRIPLAGDVQTVNAQSDEDLGLSVASGFIKLLGGELRYEDTPGGGLTVVISIPSHVPSVTP